MLYWHHVDLSSGVFPGHAVVVGCPTVDVGVILEEGSLLLLGITWAHIVRAPTRYARRAKDGTLMMAQYHPMIEYMLCHTVRIDGI